jgi:serine/threonine protein phosphatase PrpC
MSCSLSLLSSPLPSVLHSPLPSPLPSPLLSSPLLSSPLLSSPLPSPPFSLIRRVNGQLAVSRAFGDRKLKAFVPADPEITEFKITERDEYMIIASDGLWDKMDDSQLAAALIEGFDDLDVMAERLTDYANRYNTMDNTTVMVVDLQRFRSQ